jgi:hypothetical protein
VEITFDNMGDLSNGQPLITGHWFHNSDAGHPAPYWTSFDWDYIILGMEWYMGDYATNNCIEGYVTVRIHLSGYYYYATKHWQAPYAHVTFTESDFSTPWEVDGATEHPIYEY